MSDKRVAVVVLAAGASSRMGQSKQDIEIGGETLLSRTVRIAVESNSNGVVVALDKARPQTFGLQNIEVVAVENPHLGLSESIRATLAVLERRAYDAALFTPCDLPLLSAGHLNALLSVYKSEEWQIVASRYRGVLGTPLIVGAPLWGELKALQGDVGARKLIPQHLAETAFVDWEAGQFDLDTPQDVENFHAARQTGLPSA